MIEAIALLEEAKRSTKGENKKRIEFALLKVKNIQAKFDRAYSSCLWEDWEKYIAEMKGGGK